MCKAKNYLNQMQEIIHNIDEDFQFYKAEEYKLNCLQSDYLHAIEATDKFSACEGYKLTKELHNLRVERRNVKNELYAIEQFRGMLGNFKKSILSYSGTLEKVLEAQTNAVYETKCTESKSIYEFEKMIKNFRNKNAMQKKYKYM